MHDCESAIAFFWAFKAGLALNGWAGLLGFAGLFGRLGLTI